MTLKEINEHSTQELFTMVVALQRYRAFESAKEIYAKMEAGEKLTPREKVALEEHYFQELERMGEE